ncbi:MAG: DUF4258 domain-containing protein [Candidatus Accumulibacter sp.]|nr:DUF4258 domain-containing protein [Accumulibacter sp.]
MEYTLTSHAVKRCRERKIKPEWIEQALTYPAGRKTI